MGGTALPSNTTLSIGFDVGSTTVKAVVLDPLSNQVLFREYKRHGARQAQALAESLQSIATRFPGAALCCAVTGSGAAPLAQAMGVPFIQEVVANSLAVRRFFPQARTAI